MVTAGVHHPSPPSAPAPLSRTGAFELRRRPWVTGLLVGLAISATAMLSIAVVSIAVRQVLLEDLRNYLRRTAESTAALIDGDRHANLVDAAQTNSPEYAALVRPLESLLHSNPDIRYAYSGVMRGADSSFFVLDGDTSALRARVMESDRPTLGELEFARTRATVVERVPTPTAWGSGIRAYAPLGGAAGATGAYVGITMNAERYEEWLRRVYESATLGLAVALILGMFGGLSAYRAEHVRWRAAREMQRAQQLAERSEADRQAFERRLQGKQKLESLGTLAGGVAHDFNNLLTVILGNAELITDGEPAGSEAAESAASIRTAALHARDVIRRILLFSSPQAETRQVIDVAQVVDETVHLLAASMPRSIRLVWQRPAAPMLVLANGAQLTQVFMNLGVNATQALPNSRGSVTFGLERIDLDANAVTALGVSPGPYATIRVADDGVGMTERVRQRIFDPFFTTKTVGSGTGLGLSVVDAVARSHNGVVEVSSREGAGSTFTVHLPLAVRAAPDEPPTHTTSRPVPNGEGRRLLLVDDDVPVLQTTARVLRRAGYDVDAHSDAEVALDRFAASPRSYAALVTDRTMPTLSGLEVAERARAMCPTLPVILLSGAPGAGDHLAPQLSAVVAKPPDGPALLEAIAHAISAAVPDGTAAGLADEAL